jgi:uncharacterized protein YceH (UPF0502 family)
MSSEQLSTRRRAASSENLDRRTARDLVARFHLQIGEWQERVAHLRALKLAGRVPSTAVISEAEDLAPAITAARIDLEAEVEKLSPRVARHSMVEDVRRSLIRLREETDLLLN